MLCENIKRGDHTGLLTREVKVKLTGSNMRHFINKGYKIPSKRDRNTTITVDVYDLSDGSHSIVQTECNNCEKISTNTWKDFRKQVCKDGSTYCKDCSNKLFTGESTRKTKLIKSVSFEQWCINNNRQDILDRWDYELNSIKPCEIGYATNKKYWFKCPVGVHSSELKLINSFTNGQEGSIKCNQCSSFGQWMLDNKNLNPNDYWSVKNSISPYEISYGSNKRFWIKCTNCGNEKLTNINKYKNYGLACSKCSDGKSFPSKIMFSVLEQLSIKFETEKSFPWCRYYYKDKWKRGVYDFYFELNNKKYIIETDGYFHNHNNNMNGKSKEESQEIDNFKDQLANEHNIKIIRIDCEKSELEYIKQNILNSDLNDLFNLNSIDWLNCETFANNSLVNQVCKLWESGIQNTLQIAKTLNIHRKTVSEYLKKGNNLGWCNYNSKEESSKNGKLRSIMVYCVELNKVFKSIKDAGKKLKIDDSSISKACKDIYRKAGGYRWMYYNDYLNNKLAD